MRRVERCSRRRNKNRWFKTEKTHLAAFADPTTRHRDEGLGDCRFDVVTNGMQRQTLHDLAHEKIWILTYYVLILNKLEIIEI